MSSWNARNKEKTENFKGEKESVLGELSMVMGDGYNNNYKDELNKEEEYFPPPPPVFQTYAAQLSGKFEEEEPFPPPTPGPGNFISSVSPRPFGTPSSSPSLIMSPKLRKTPSSPNPPPLPSNPTPLPSNPPPIPTNPPPTFLDSSFGQKRAPKVSFSSPKPFRPVDRSESTTNLRPLSSLSSKQSSTFAIPSTESKLQATTFKAVNNKPKPWIGSKSPEPISPPRSLSSSSLSSHSSANQSPRQSQCGLSSGHAASRRVLGEYPTVSEDHNEGNLGSKCQQGKNSDDIEAVIAEANTALSNLEIPSKLNRPKNSCHTCCKEVLTDGCSALGRSYHQECFKCYNCAVKLECKFLTDKDQPFCEKCYQELTCPACVVCGDTVYGDGMVVTGDVDKVYHTTCLTCNNCNSGIEGNFFSQEGNFLCHKCAKEESENQTCERCSSKILGECLVSNGKYYHHHCMKCSVCGDNLRGTYFTSDDQLICEKDYKKSLKVCSDCGDEIKGSFYSLDNGKIVCEKDYKRQLGNCAKCRQVVEGKIMKVSGNLYHPSCFTCTVCSISLVGVAFNMDDNKQIYCTQDFNRRNAAVCSVCCDPIIPHVGETSAQRLRAMGRDFHPECFKCQDCGLVLDSRVSGRECYPVGDSPLCMKCSRNRQN